MRIILIVLLVFTYNVCAQQDFNRFKTLRSEGKIPEDFSRLTLDKIEEDKGSEGRSLSKAQEKVFLEGIHYGIDQLLHSGMVIYGDEISNYVSEVADKLLKKRYASLRGKLRFYTIKSNASNALSTDQGIVFVTTGLLSQLTSEAQLAFILAHEIAHYQEKHVVESFEYRNQRNRNTIKQLSVYSKEKELIADKVGIEIYNAAGYSKSQLLSSFDVLMYSYLPFEEVTFPKSYFNTDLLFVPESFFPNKKYEIKVIEDYDDSESSHPNIKKRKSEAISVINIYKNWGDIINYLGEERFIYIRNLCRFESIRTDILNANYADALYSIFILEKDFPNSDYLKRMKAQSWLGIAQYKSDGSINETVDRNSELEGEIASVHYFIKRLNLEATITMSLRQIQDVKNDLPNDEEVHSIWKKILLLSADVKKFNIQNYSSLTFNSAVVAKLEVKDSSEIKKGLESLNKYERIKRKKNYTDPTVFDSTKFYHYALTDLIEDEVFISKYNHIRDSLDLIQKEINAYNDLSYYEKRKRNKEKANSEEWGSGISEFILVEPAAISYKKRRVDYKASEKIKTRYEEAINNAGSFLDMSIYTINSKNLNELGTLGFNERSTLTNLLFQFSQNQDIDVFPVDFSYLKEIEKNYGTTKIVFTIVEHAYRPEFSSSALWLIFYPPALLGYLPIPFMNGNLTELNLLVLDTKTGKVDKGISYTFNEPTTKLILESRMYDILKNLKN
jgi:beta-barrel assembly-enhancing protease